MQLMLPEWSKLAPKGEPLRQLQQKASGTGYNAAGGGRRTQGWNTTVEGVNSILFADEFKLLQRSRDQVRQNPWAANAIESYVSNSIGNGISPHPQHPDPEVRRVITKAWNRSNDELDADGILPFQGMQSLIARSALEGGECFTRMMTVPIDSDVSVPLKLRVMESEQLPIYMLSYPSAASGNIVRMGIEMEPDTKFRVAYHFFQEHPYETVMFSGPAQKFVRVPAREIAHHFKPLRPGQIRGLPWLAPVLAQLYEIDSIQDAELARQKTQSLFAGFIEVNSAQDSVFNEANKVSSDPSGAGSLDAAMPGLEPGVLIKLLAGEKISFATPTVAPGFGDFMRISLHAVAAGMGITYEQLTGDLKEVNYSSIRAGLVEFRRRIEQYQYNIFAFQVLRPIWRRWMELAVLVGVLPFRDFVENRADYESVIWQPPGFEWVDPLKDVTASIAAIRAGLDSRERIVRERGMDPEAIDQDNKVSQDRARRLNLVYESDPSQILERGETLDSSATAQGKAQAEEPPPTPPKKPKTNGIRTTEVLQ